MHNKKTVIIFNTSENREISFAIKEYLSEDKTVLPIIIAEEELNSALINIADDKILGDDSPVLALKHLYRKVAGGFRLDEAPKKSPEFNNDRTAHKKMLNIFKRYAPDLLVCMSARCLRAAIAVKKFLRSDTRIAVYFSEYLADRNFIFPEVEIYFAESDFIKNNLVSCGVESDKIIVNRALSRKRYLNAVDRTVAKQELGLPKDKLSVFIVADGHLNGSFSELALQLQGIAAGYGILVYCGYDRGLLKELLKKSAPGLVARNEGLDMNLAFSAADVVVCRPRGEILAVAAAKQCYTVTFGAEGERQRRSAANLALDSAAKCETCEDVAEQLAAFEKHAEEFRKKLADNYSAPEDAGEKLKNILIAMMK